MMGTVNHPVRGGQDLQLAMIEGTTVMAFCGIRFVPSVQVGTSGRADDPGAPTCEQCTEAINLWREWIRIKDEKNRLIREMRALEKLHSGMQKEWRATRETVGVMRAVS